jgi:outer membrane autotransporter protein
MDCPVSAHGYSRLDCRTPGLRIWGQVDGSFRTQDGDVEAPAYDAERWSMVIGADTSVGTNGLVGGSIGRVSNRADFWRFGSRINGEGIQAGLYGAYDPGAYFVKAMGSWSTVDGDSKRRIDIGDVVGQAMGDPDVRQWTLGLRTGARFAVGSGTLTPYFNLDHVNTKLKSFTETGVAGANLAVKGGKEGRTFTTTGASYALHVGGGAIIEANAGWRHMLGDRRSKFTALFADQSGADDFDIVSARESRNSLVTGISLGGKVAGVNVRVGYDGAYDGQSKVHAGNFKIVVPFGGGSPRSDR